MNKILLIIHYELTTLLSRKSYLVIIFIVPIIGFLVYSGAALLNRGIAPEGVNNFFGAPAQAEAQGMIDHSGLIKEIPADLSEKIIRVNNEAEGQRLVEEGNISAYFIIAEDYLESGNVLFVQRDYNFLATQSETDNIRELITRNLFSDAQLAERYIDPMETEIVYTREQTAKDFGGSQNFWLPYSLMMLFYMLIIGASSMMLNSITHEKQNRVIEILLTSISTNEMLIGKTIALGLAGLLQTIAWIGSGYVLLNLAGRQFAIPDSFTLDPSILIWGIIFFILGYALYSSLMAGLGALVPNPKEGSQATLVVIFPLIIPLFFSNLVATTPNAPIFVFFSLFPLTSPISMISRMSATSIPAWQLALSILLLIIFIILAIRSVARIFRAQALLSGKPFNAKEYFQAFLIKN